MQTLSILSALLVARPGAALPAPDVAIVGARVEIGDGRVVENGTVVVRGDKILSVGTDPAPSGATVIDGKGLVVYPGFIDAYSTSGLKLPDALPNGPNPPDTLNTAPATMWHNNRKNIRADVSAAKSLDMKGPFKDQHAQGITSVLVSGGNGLLAGTSALIDLAEAPKVVVAEAASELVLPRGAARRPGEDVHGDMAGAQRPQQPTQPQGYSYPGTMFGFYALIRQTLADAKYHAAQDKPKTDPTYEGLKPLVTGRVPALFTATQARDVARAARIADEFGFKFIINGTYDTYRMIDLLKTRNVPVVLSVESPLEPRRTASTEPDSMPQRVVDDRYADYKERLLNAKALNDAGIVLAFKNTGTDGYLAGIRKMIANGLPREAALKAMTLNAATIYGAADRLGTVAPGKIANLVLMTGDFADEKSKVQSVLVEGTRFETEKAK